MRKKILVIVSALILSCIAYGLYLYFKPRADTTNLKAIVQIKAAELYTQYQEDEKSADKKYLGKIISVEGIINDEQTTGTTMSLQLSGGNAGGINCALQKGVSDIPAKGMKIMIKGRCTGFLMDVNLTDCVLEKP